ncbi:hypothetical protein XU18_1500 [Perkinsela sp. CCAP 1560/4]|nr:hypothetical protein XU18_1500 [Perkinsela sp. CCAP 1560/4]|eukprot:KNH07914.1 hypothetical protein XU18_1500 [Perkinsela sp. CCAP 1560/4]
MIPAMCAYGKWCRAMMRERDEAVSLDGFVRRCDWHHRLDILPMPYEGSQHVHTCALSVFNVLMKPHDRSPTQDRVYCESAYRAIDIHHRRAYHTLSFIDSMMYAHGSTCKDVTFNGISLCK